ncbi:ABC transporter permease [Sphingobacterium sp. SRCM116780]|uniref:ABC transporter permease n=1 Tax=Sphingobacterium sp. SRCM116780 TaxID=2907623 RepID=UPI001F225055|nr:ABC transporter permease [Sphingobacterium sp. SRCM116780]UIR55119.1 ABC transporter permease [Sphingobacterium sp. SRCM116780]
MIFKYIKTGWRNLKKSKFYTAINILGLSISIATAILILLWVQDEIGYDRFHKDYKRIYNVHNIWKGGDKEQISNNTPGPVGFYAKDIPAVESSVRIAQEYNGIISLKEQKDPYTGLSIAYADSTFFSFFSFPLLQSSKPNVLTNIDEVTISETLSKKLFHGQDAIGKTILLGKNPFFVTGVFLDIPQNSSIRFDVIFPMAYQAKSFTENGGNGVWKTIDEDLGNYYFDTYLKLKPAADPEQAIAQINNRFIKAKEGSTKTTFKLGTLEDKHLIAPDGNKSALRMVQIFGVVALLLLFIGAINYVNLSTARAMDRAKEVSIRKIIGANRQQLFFQFMSETFLTFILATLVAALWIGLSFSAYNTISGKSMVFSLGNPALWLLIGSALLVTVLLSSIYPSIQLSAFKPITALKGKSSKPKNSIFRKALVVFQYVTSIILIICTLVIQKQMKYIREYNLGYDTSYIFTVQLNEGAVENKSTVAAKLAEDPSIVSYSINSVYDPMSYGNSTGDIDWPNRAKDYSLIVARATIDKNFIPLMGMKLIEGSNLKGVPADSSSYIINETLAKQMGLKKPYVGAQMSLHEVPGTVVGVVQDFNFNDLKNPIGPMVFWTHRYSGTLYVKTTASNAQKAIEKVKTIYNSYPSTQPFEYTFLDSKFDKLYKSDLRTGLLFNIFASIAIFVSSLGLLALAANSAQTKVKEIGIRKVLGASIPQIVQLLGREFVGLLLVAILIAGPLAWYFSKEWLANFSFRTELNIWIFLIGASIALLIAGMTIGYQAIRAAKVNVIDSLRDE